MRIKERGLQVSDYDHEGFLPDPEEMRADYQQTAACFRDRLPVDASCRAEVGDGLFVYAIRIPAYTAYGAQGGEDSLLGVISEFDDDGGKAYSLTLYHLGERLGEETHPPEEVTYRTGFGDSELEDYDADFAEKVRSILEGATAAWFDSIEAWYQVKNRYPAAVIRGAYNGQRRSEARMRRALTALGIAVPEGSVTDAAA